MDLPFSIFGIVPVCSFYSFKEVQGYKMFVGGVILIGEGARGLRRALSDGAVVCTIEAWCWYSWYCRYMPRYAHHYDLTCCCMVCFLTYTVMRDGWNNVSSQDVPRLWARADIEVI
jgi:hypothetical protein